MGANRHVIQVNVRQSQEACGRQFEYLDLQRQNSKFW